MLAGNPEKNIVFAKAPEGRHFITYSCHFLRPKEPFKNIAWLFKVPLGYGAHFFLTPAQFPKHPL